MTQTKIDPKYANIEECRRWLAEHLCPECGGRKRLPAQAYVGGATGKVDCRECQGIGLAFPWASTRCDCGRSASEQWRHANKACPHCRNQKTHSLICEGKCNGSGRVPKAVGLEELFEHGLQMIQHQDGGGKEWWLAWWGKAEAEAETPLLAALRAKVKAEM